MCWHIMPPIAWFLWRQGMHGDAEDSPLPAGLLAGGPPRTWRPLAGSQQGAWARPATSPSWKQAARAAAATLTLSSCAAAARPPSTSLASRRSPWSPGRQ